MCLCEFIMQNVRQPHVLLCEIYVCFQDKDKRRQCFQNSVINGKPLHQFDQSTPSTERYLE